MSKNIYAEVTAKIVAQLEAGVAPWVRPWSRSTSSRDRGARDRMQPHNLASNRPYHGINAVILMMVGTQYPTGAWATYKQISEAGGQVRRGEKATQVVYFDRIEVKDKTKPNDPEATKRIPLLRYFSVFNHAQADWPADKDPFRARKPNGKVEPEAPRMPKCDETISATGARIEHGGDDACYIPALDMIRMPQRKQFPQIGEYYSTAFHELTHWTSHASRCDRQLGKRFGDNAYAFEELIAEMGAAFLCAEHGIDALTRHASYLEHWAKCLREDDQAIFRAAALAQKAAKFIYNDEPETVEEEEA